MNDMSSNTQTGFNAPLTDADWSDLRVQTLAAHETPALFESIAGIADTETDMHEEFETDEGKPVSAYASPLSLWEMKTGRLTPVSGSKRGLWSRIKWGVIDAVVEEKQLERRKSPGVYLHPKYPFLSSRLDAEVSDDGGLTWMPLVAHNVAASIADTWRTVTGEWTPPEHIYVQAQHHMAVTGAERMFIVALFAGTNIRSFTIDRDDEIIADIEDGARGFWNLVEQDQPPAADFDRDGDVLRRICSKIDPKTEVVDRRNDAELLALLRQKSEINAEIRDLTKSLENIKAQLSKKMDGVGVAIISDDRQLYWQVTPPKKVSYVKKEARTLREKKISDKTAGTPIGDLLAAS